MPVICFYPMSKARGETRNWYTLPFEERKQLMGGHGATGRKFAGRVLQLITSCTGLDDWEWGVTLFARDLKSIPRRRLRDALRPGQRRLRPVRRVLRRAALRARPSSPRRCSCSATDPNAPRFTRTESRAKERLCPMRVTCGAGDASSWTANRTSCSTYTFRAHRRAAPRPLVKTKVRNLRTGNVFDRTFKAQDRVIEPQVEAARGAVPVQRRRRLPLHGRRNL